MRLSNFKRLLENDYPKEFRSLVAKLAISINSGIDGVYDALNRKLTFKDNFKCVVADINLETDSSGNLNTQKSFIKLDLDGSIGYIIVGQITGSRGGKPVEAPTTAVMPIWKQENDATNGNIIRFQSFTGLSASSSYTIKLILVYT